MRMKVRDVETLVPLTVGPDTDLERLASLVTDRGIAYVTSQAGELSGVVTGSKIISALASGYAKGATAQDIMIPAESFPSVEPDTDLHVAAGIFESSCLPELPVMENGVLVASLTQRSVLMTFSSATATSKGDRYHEERALAILRSLNEGLIVIDRDLTIREFNPAAERLMNARAADRVGQKAVVVSRDESPIFEVMNTGKARYNVMTPLADGRVFSVNYVPLIEDGEVRGIIETFHDVTEQEHLRAQLVSSRDELDRAFALTLPNSRVEHKLKHTPEYRDKYDPETGLITVTEVIEDGNYKHVVNALKVLADLNSKGIMSLLGISKDILVQSLIFHDLGKSQPQLEVGQTVDPKKAFEYSPAHAARSADIAAHFYHKDQDVIWLVRYHHHKEDELPLDFPRHLMPMLRLLQLVDGLSAALTRRNATIKLDVEGTRVTVHERNGHPDFNRSRVVDLFTGEAVVIDVD
ncbi:MAG: PAS domain-containing protein [Firmicutes bacterium]|jgi:PAS domain S-box-containing protein|nr:PAS domain-containing protein [Bacillota bacterium]MDH7496325.1 PAS domain-containing protein [Bacillota bacterium]